MESGHSTVVVNFIRVKVLDAGGGGAWRFEARWR